MIEYNITLEDSWKIFDKVFNNNVRYYLPIRWDGSDYYAYIKQLFNAYADSLPTNTPQTLSSRIKQICGLILDAVQQYFHGFPSDAYDSINALMGILIEDPLLVHPSLVHSMYRIVSVDENIRYEKQRAFHVPYNMRNKISTCRYSISGYPSLYLSSSLQLSDEEMGLFAKKEKAIASRFEIEPSASVKILEMSFRPQDLLKSSNVIKGVDADMDDNRPADRTREQFVHYCLTYGPGDEWLLQPALRYLLWYPLIASCSFIRSSRDSSFAPEYIVPQLLTQWLRAQNVGRLVGIRYFSCRSVRASDLGENYVFPASGDPTILKDRTENYCPILNEMFSMTDPVFLCDFETIKDVERSLLSMPTGNIFPLPRESFKFDEHVRIPKDIMYLPAHMFADCTKLQHVEIPDSITSLGASSFNNCASLSEIKLPNHLKTIGGMAFFGCTSLREISIPDSVKQIDGGLFGACENLGKIAVPNNKYFYCLENCIIEKNTGTLVTGILGGEQFCIPDSVNAIGKNAFMSCKGSSIISFGETTTEIGDCAFYGCSSIEHVKFGRLLRKIGKKAFKWCDSLKSVDVNENLEIIRSSAFSHCSSLELISLPPSLFTIEQKAFEGCSSLKEIIIPDGVRFIDPSAFEGCTSLTSIKLSNKLLHIQDAAFSQCKNLLSFTVPSGTLTIGDCAFYGCEKMEWICIPETVMVIGSNAFSNCPGLKEIRYAGSEEDWAKIEKIKGWDSGFLNVEVLFRYH